MPSHADIPHGAQGSYFHPFIIYKSCINWDIGSIDLT
jgi:hypothetical protein